MTRCRYTPAARLYAIAAGPNRGRHQNARAARYRQPGYGKWIESKCRKTSDVRQKAAFSMDPPHFTRSAGGR
jgi:hypothetical protein